MNLLNTTAQKNSRLNKALTISTVLIILAVFAVTVFKYRLFVITTSSMEPEYKVNSLVLIEKVPFESVKTGDVIAFKSKALNGRLAFHRVIDVTKNGSFITKGDNSANTDGAPVTKQNYFGKGVFHTGIFAGILPFIRSGYGRILILGAVTLTAAFIITLKKLKKTL